jgi:hypothetical protein
VHPAESRPIVTHTADEPVLASGPSAQCCASRDLSTTSGVPRPSASASHDDLRHTRQHPCRGEAVAGTSGRTTWTPLTSGINLQSAQQTTCWAPSSQASATIVDVTINPAARYVSVLDTGLPVLPARVTAGQPLAVAVWIGPRFGAVTVIEDCDHDSFCTRDEHHVAMTYAYQREPDGWTLPIGGGGTDWPGGTSTNASLEARQVLFDGGRSGSSRGWMCSMVEGFAGSDARWVELNEGPETTRRAIAASGAFVVVLNGEGPATVTILDHDEQVIATYDF